MNETHKKKHKKVTKEDISVKHKRKAKKFKHKKKSKRRVIKKRLFLEKNKMILIS
jgi:hypothetical protein